MKNNEPQDFKWDDEKVVAFIDFFLASQFEIYKIDKSPKDLMDIFKNAKNAKNNN